MNPFRLGTIAAVALSAYAEQPIKVEIVRNPTPFKSGRFANAGAAIAFSSLAQPQTPQTVVIWRAPVFPVRKADPASTFRGVLLRAEGGSTNAMLELAKLYRTGTGTETNDFEARVWEIRAGK